MAGCPVVGAVPAFGCRPEPRVTAGEVRAWLDAVPDPEIPVLSVNDLGVVRDVRIDGGVVTLSIAPTYIGCPATEVIENMIVAEVKRHGVRDVTVRRVLSPAWTTDWLSDAARRKLQAYGIAPPHQGAGRQALSPLRAEIKCPRCHSPRTTRVSEFGSTPCKAAFRCRECLEPFEYFKCI